MNIKNYTSAVEASTSIAKIEEMLVQIGASNINKRYVARLCTGITFLLFDMKLQQILPFHLKAQVEDCFTHLWQEAKQLHPHTRTQVQQQATRVAWQILCDWAEAQCALILLGHAKPLELFLPFMYDDKVQETLFDKISMGKVKLLQG